jgi:hypothetical protein
LKAGRHLPAVRGAILRQSKLRDLPGNVAVYHGPGNEMGQHDTPEQHAQFLANNEAALKMMNEQRGGGGGGGSSNPNANFNPAGWHPGGGGGAPESPVGAVANFSGTVNANSGGGPSPFGSAPDITGNPALAKQLTDFYANNTYSFAAGGWIPNAQAQNANSYQSKFGAGQGGDAGSNAAAARLFGQVGDLPTRNIGTSALQAFNAGHGITPAARPSINSTLGPAFAANPDAMRDAGFGPRYQGPYQFGHPDPRYNMWGSFKG